MSKPEMMKPKCSFCENEFTPGPIALLGLPATVTDEKGDVVEQTTVNVCDKCRRRIDMGMQVANKIRKAQMN